MNGEIDEVKLENRLTNMEASLSNLNTSMMTGFNGTHQRLDTLNSKVARHEEYINNAKLEARELKGFMEGRSSLRKKDLAILGTILAVMATAIQLVWSVIGDKL